MLGNNYYTVKSLIPFSISYFELLNVTYCFCQLWSKYVAYLFRNIYNGNIFPSLNPAKIFQFISRWTESTKSSAVGPNHRAVINTSNEVKSPLLWEFWINNFSLRMLERVLRWKHCKYKEWVSFFLGSWGMNRSAEQTNRPRTALRFTRFVCPVLRFIPHEPRKKDTHSLNQYCLNNFRTTLVTRDNTFALITSCGKSKEDTWEPWEFRSRNFTMTSEFKLLLLKAVSLYFITWFWLLWERMLYA